jgi:hypothetical protein
LEEGGSNAQLQEMLRGIDLPAGFTFLELFQTLDHDGNGTLTKKEFVSGVMRLIHSSEFHRECMVSCGLGQLKQAAVQNKADFHSEIHAVFAEVRQDIAALRKEMQEAFAQASSKQPQEPGSDQEKAEEKDRTGVSASCRLLPPSANAAVLLPDVQLEFRNEIELHEPAWMQKGTSVEIVPRETQDLAFVVAAGKPNVPGGSAIQVEPGTASQTRDAKIHETANSKSMWEPLQMSVMPTRLLTGHPQLGAELSAALLRSTPNSPARNIVGFLPVVGSICQGGETTSAIACLGKKHSL